MKAVIHKLELPAAGRIIAISDVHGNLPYLRGLLDKLDLRGEDTLVFCGDMVEKGGQSLETLRYIMRLAKERRVLAVQGNCDCWQDEIYRATPRSDIYTKKYLLENSAGWGPGLLAQMSAEIGFEVREDTDMAEFRRRIGEAFAPELDFLERLMAHLEEGKSARSFPYTEDEAAMIASSPLLSNKPIIYAANMCEDDFINGYENNPHYQAVAKIAAEEKSAVLPICAKIEEEIADMTDDEKKEFLADLNLKESGLNRIIREGYALLGYISFLTAGEPEVRAWTITKGTKAPQAAGKIHTDFERGFIRAEVVAFDDLMACGSMAAAKEKGLVRLEGKEYVMQDGDIVLFRFNV